MADKKVIVKISGDSSEAEQAIQKTTKSLETLRRESAGKADKIVSFEQATTDLEKMQSALDETRRKLAYFKEQAKLGGDTGTKAFAADIRATEREIDKLNAGMRQQRQQVGQLSGGLAKAGVDTRNLAAEKARLSAAVANAERGIINLKGKLQEEQAAAQAAAARTKEAGAAAEKAGSQANAGAGGMGNMATAMKTLAAAAVVREFVQTNASMESMTKSLEMVTGSSEAAKREMAFVREESSRLGLEIVSAANSYMQLAASAKGTALEGQATRDIWSAVAESMARLGKTTAETDGALLAISQMMSKGVVSAEELRGQLGERLPGAFQAAARAMGTTTQGLGEMLEKGEIIAADFLPKFAAELNKLGSQDGEGFETFTARWNRLKNSLKEGATTFNDIIPLFDAVSWTTGKTAGVIGLATGAFGMLGAKIKGDADGIEKYRQSIMASGDAVFGFGKKHVDAAKEVEGLANSVTESATRIETDIKNRIVASMLKLDGSIKNTSEAFKTLGVDPDEIVSGISASENQIIESFKTLAADPNVSGQVLLGSLLVALDQVSKEAIPEIGFAYKAAANVGRQSSDELVAGLDAIASKTAGLWPETNNLADAYKKLGITSQAELKKTASEMESAYQTLVKMKAPLVDQQAAWAKYAQAAIAANGGVADSTLTAAAAQHGYKVVVDQSGKAHLKSLQEVQAATESQTDAQNRLTESVAETGQAAATAADSAAEGTERASQGVTSLANAWESHFRSFSKEAGDYYAEVLDLGLRNVAAWNATWKAIGAAIDRTQREMDAAQKWYGEMMDNLEDGKAISDAFYESGVRGAETFKILGEQRLSTLLSALDSAKDKTDALRDSARDTLTGIQDELDGLNQNYDEIERRRAASRKADLAQKLQSAQEAGDGQAVADLSRALSLLNRVNNLRIKEAVAKEAEAKAKAAETASPAQTSANKTIDVNFNHGGKSVTATIPEKDEAAFNAMLAAIKNDMARSI